MNGLFLWGFGEGFLHLIGHFSTSAFYPRKKAFYEIVFNINIVFIRSPNYCTKTCSFHNQPFLFLPAVKNHLVGKYEWIFISDELTQIGAIF